ncbi:MAG: hypothetical protein CO125_10350 [Hydrogenophilales bacterium CG_4_9_14_3_um_filter_59_35]|nr:MAG: hypothetical protein COZ23_13170 [Hydrogenophilales bacterium CG_4_10_14_3_um_filter_58_23]PJB04958.1 MAG: hypothetical protein CO125_10350 [Hydrogenophilales bacterium CG_4_9_14_3_um_filter_59_35]
MNDENLMLFTLNASRAFGERIGQALGIPLSEHEEREFEDGEHKSRPLVNVRGRDVFVVQSLYADAEQSINDKLCRLLFFIGSFRKSCCYRQPTRHNTNNHRCFQAVARCPYRYA